MTNAMDKERFCELAGAGSERLFEELVEYRLSPAHILNEQFGKSFILPDANHMTFDKLVELKPEDMVYRGISAQVLGKIRRTGLVDVEDATTGEGRLYVTRRPELAKEYAAKNWNDHAVMGILVRDVPSGVLPPDYRYSGDRCVYYGNMSGIGVISQSFKFKDYMAENGL